MHYFDTGFIRDIAVASLENRKSGESVRAIIEDCIEATIRADNRLREVTRANTSSPTGDAVN